MPPEDWSRDFPAFAPAFELGPYESKAYLALLNLHTRSTEVVLVVAQCLDAAEDKRKQVRNLLRGVVGFEIDRLRAKGRHLQLSDAEWNRLMESSNWRPQLVGCVALLAMNAQERPLDALLDAACRLSWVSPQLLATTSLVAVPDWSGQVEGAILDRDDAKAAAAKAAAALCALQGGGSSDLIELATLDTQYGGDIAVGWRNRIRTVFDEADIAHSW